MLTGVAVRAAARTTVASEHRRPARGHGAEEILDGKGATGRITFADGESSKCLTPTRDALGVDEELIGNGVSKEQRPTIFPRALPPTSASNRARDRRP